MHVCIEWESVLRHRKPRVFVGDAPGLEAFTVVDAEACCEQIIVDCGLLCELLTIPWYAVAILPFTFDINLREMHLDTQLIVSLHVLNDAFNRIVISNIHVQLEANAVN